MRKIKWDNPAEWDMNVVNEWMDTASEHMANDILKQRKRIGGDWSWKRSRLACGPVLR